MDMESKLINEAWDRIRLYRSKREANLNDAKQIKDCEERVQKWMDRFDLFAAAALQGLVGSQAFADLCREDCDTEADNWVVERAIKIAREVMFLSYDPEFWAYNETTYDMFSVDEKGELNVRQKS